jgi:hypothetical protein
MLSRDLNNYSAPWIDEPQGVTNPELEQPAASANRMAEDLAQTTRAVPRAHFNFLTTATAAPIVVAFVDSANVWGEGSGSAPVIAKTATGTYEAVFATSFEDGLAGTIADAESETEDVNFRFGGASVRGSTRGDAQVDLNSNNITIYVFDAAGVLSDLGGGRRVDVWAR